MVSKLMYFFQCEGLVHLKRADGVTSLSFIAAISYFLRSANAKAVMHSTLFVSSRNEMRKALD
jgi:hypothetical protein